MKRWRETETTSRSDFSHSTYSTMMVSVPLALACRRWLLFLLLLLLTVTILIPSASAAQMEERNDNNQSHSDDDTCITDGDCRNGGICQELSSAFVGSSRSRRHCHCPSGFSGVKCTRYCPLSCQHGGVCTHVSKKLSSVAASNNIVGYGKSYVDESLHLDQQHYFAFDAQQYYCKCKGYFTGDWCDLEYVNCHRRTSGNGASGGGNVQDHYRCYHGGTCSQDSGGDTTTTTISSGCDCPEGFDGDFCQNVIIVITEEKTLPQLSSREGMSKGGKTSLSLLVVLIALACCAIYVKRKATSSILQYARWLFSTNSLQRRRQQVTLPKVLQDATTTSFIVSYRGQGLDTDHDDLLVDDGASCSSDESSTHHGLT